MGKIKKFIKKHPVFIYIAALIPFVVSCYGYYITGKFTFWEFVYAAIAVYFVNPVSEDVNAFILFGEITSVIVTAGIILSVLKYAYAKIEHFFIRLKKDSTVVYTDNELGYALASSLKNGYATENDSRPEKVKNHIVMFENDAKNITFYSQNETRLKNQKVFMMMTELDSTLLKATDTSEADLHFFNTNELLARDYWKKYNLYNHKDKSFKIAIIGNNDVADAIFKYGYLNNLYTLEQSFEYHIWGLTGAKAKFIGNLPTDNKDTIIIHENDAFEFADAFKEIDRVIYCFEENSIDMIQMVLYVNPTAEIHCYFKEETSYEDIYDSDKIITFGALDDLLTEESVKKESLYLQGKLFNYDYALRYSERCAPSDYKKEMENEWKKLSGFKKSSSIARADHYWIEKKLKEDGILSDEDEDALKIEHIRWSRFHFINHWSYAEKRDNEKRKHNLLVPYEKLSDAERAKDGIYDKTIKREIEKLV
ncbi:RyR domain-containing protein [Butyrivibrio sp. INlla21]|uniref:RyR domain-containing protein n=1 Tax=Butyrivibrio sp. INlla21 TaxID=1520811 RepID=UPI0008EDDADB|nr:RyR domain-containing protein [Butyrivibrio sp. INlla21]SFU85520.1 RyR domain-containing protein [Butyrivibrio sp. INlla21]